jgi:uncharacterized damage-inducible protein DinB
MADDMITKPTIETILERMAVSDERFEQRFDELEKKTDERFDQFEKRTGERFDKLEKELDRLIMVTSSTRADMSELRLGFRELRDQVKELLPIPRE